MKKSVKRVIAVFLATLMIVFSFPFSALAFSRANQVGDAQLLFYAATLGRATSKKCEFNNYFDYTPSKRFSINYKGSAEMPLVYDKATKSLTAKQSIANNLPDTLKNLYTKNGDYKLQNGDYIWVVGAIAGFDTLTSVTVRLKYQGVEPAAVYKVSGDSELYTFDTTNAVDPTKPAEQQIMEDDELEAGDLSKEMVGQTALGKPVTPLTVGENSVQWASYFPTADAENGTDVHMEKSEIDWGISSIDPGDCTEMKSAETGTYSSKNPETGEPDYVWRKRAPLETWLMKVTDADNISFSLDTNEYDSIAINPTMDASMDAGYFYGIYNNWHEVLKNATTMAFMGDNEYWDEEPVTQNSKVTFNDADGNAVSTVEGASGTEYTIPSLDSYSKAPDKDYHYKAAWQDASGAAPTGTFGDADQTYTLTYVPTAHTFTSTTKDATDTEDGSTTYTCSDCGYSYTETIPAKGHSYAAPVFTWSDIVATNDEQSANVTATKTCVNNDSTLTGTVNVTKNVTALATEEAAGSVTFTATATFSDGTEATEDKTVEIPKLAHTHKYGKATFAWDGTSAATATRTCTAGDDASQTVDAVITSETTDATCTTAGKTVYTATATFDDGTVETDTKTVEIPALGHEYGKAEFTWNADNTATATRKCVRGDDSQTVDATVTSETTPATRKTAGKTVYTATATFADGTVATDTKEDAISATGVNITVGATDLGNASIDGEPTNGVETTKNYKFGNKYTVTADGDNFLGWEINGKLVSTTATYSSIAYTDVTITPVFKDASAGINVYFYDKYGNLFKSFEGVTADAYKAAVADAVPEAPTYPGYTFTGYDKSDDEIKANEANATYVAQYKKAEKTYKVTAGEGATITAKAGTVEGNVATVPYDTQVTVSAEGAQGWAIDGKTVAYGDTYTFYVGSDVTVTPVATAEAAPTVAIISEENNAPYYTVLATRASGNATIVERGWIYGRDAEDSQLADIDTAKAAGLAVKQAKVTNSEQFALTLKSKKAGTIKVRAFITDSQGNVYYSDIYNLTVS